MPKRLIAPKLFYFFWFAAMGFYIPYVGLYYRSVGLDLARIGLLVALPGLLQIIATPLWGLVADGLQIHRILLPLVVAGTLPPVLLTGRTSAFELLVGLVAILALFTAPVAPLADSATLAALGDQRSRYGAQRVWGAVGWGLSTLSAGALVQRLGLAAAFPSYALIAALAALVALFLPRARLPRVDLRSAAWAMASDARWARFLGSVFLIGCCNAVINGFLSLYLQDLGASGQQIGLAIGVASVSELPVMVLAPMVLRRWGARPLLICAGLLYALRAGIYVATPSLGWALAAQVLHGPGFAALWTGGVDEAQRLAPKGMEMTAQSLFGTLFFGVATAIASVVGGWIYRDLGSGALFGAGSLAAALGVVGILAARRQAEVAAPASLES
ncbi:MAG TPA: MFS transporter [Roseiflexaceae bacterium]|nr:MFS transporter [Roseiflexaceae bacterium]